MSLRTVINAAVVLAPCSFTGIGVQVRPGDVVVRSDFHAIGLITLALAFCLGAYVASLNYPKQQRYQPYRYAADKPQEVDAALTRPTSAQTFEYRAPCHEPKGKDESDLCAQWKAANAAADSALWAKWSFWIGVIGSSLLLWQIVLTRRAVEDTGKATEAMERQNEIASETARRQLRPYLVFDGVSHALQENIKYNGVQHDHMMEFRVKFKNVGTTPAVNAFVFGTAGILVPYDDPPPVFGGPNNLPSDLGLAIGPGQLGFANPFYLPADDLAAIVSLEKALYLFVNAEYTDMTDPARKMGLNLVVRKIYGGIMIANGTQNLNFFSQLVRCDVT